MCHNASIPAHDLFLDSTCGKIKALLFKGLRCHTFFHRTNLTHMFYSLRVEIKVKSGKTPLSDGLLRKEKLEVSGFKVTTPWPLL